MRCGLIWCVLIRFDSIRFFDPWLRTFSFPAGLVLFGYQRAGLSFASSSFFFSFSGLFMRALISRFAERR